MATDPQQEKTGAAEASRRSRRIAPLHPGRSQEGQQSQGDRDVVRFRSILERITDAVMALDLAHRCTYANEAAAALLETTPEELVGKAVWDVLPGLDRSWFHEEVSRRGSEKTAWGFEVPCEPPGGCYQCRCHRDHDGTTLFLTRTTARRQAGQDVHDTHRRLQARTEKLNAAHEKLQAQTRELHQLKQALVASERKYHDLLRTTKNIIIRWDNRGAIKFINDYGLQFFGYSAEGLLDRDVTTLVPKMGKSAGKARDALIADILAHPDRHTSVPTESVRKDGKTVWVAWTSEAIVDEQGHVQEILAVGNDITRLKEAEAGLRDSEERLRMAQAAGGVGTFDWDLASQEASCSREYFHVLGRPSRTGGQVTFAEWQTWVHPDDRGRVLPVLEASLANTAEVSGEYRMLGEDDTIRWIFYRAVIARDPQGRAVRMLGTAQDVTQRKQAEEALRTNEERLRLALEAAHLISFDWDIQRDEMRRFIANEPTLAPVREEAPSTLEQVCRSVHPEDRERFTADLRAAIERRDGRYESEFRIVHPDGAVAWLHERGLVQRDAQGRAARLIGLSQDVTDRKRAAEEIRSAALFPQQNPSPVLRVAEDGTLLYSNSAGVDVLELWGCQVGERVPEEIHRPVREALASGQSREMEITCGSIVYSLSLAPIVEDAYVDLYGRDITQRKRMEEQLQQLNERLAEEVKAQTRELQQTVERLREEVAQRVLAEDKVRRRSQMLDAFFRHSFTPLAFLDRDFRFVRVNDAYARASGRPCEFFVGKNHFALYPHAENEAIFRRVVQTKQPYRAFAKPFVYPDDSEGRTSYWNWQLTPLLDEQGQVDSLVLNLEDVTEQQVAVQELERRAGQLQRLTLELTQAEERERKRLAELLHDDLQQQLAAATFHIGLLDGRLKADRDMQDITGQLADLLRDAIEKSRSLSHELSPAVLYQNDLGEVFEWLSRQFEAKHGLRVQVEVRGQTLSRSDPLKVFLFRAAQEILFNTIKHANVHEANLRIQRRRGHIWLTIGDKGRGFDAEQFGQTAGYGLMSIRERAELLGGRMRIRSAVGRGSTFLIAMPDAEAVELAEVEAEPAIEGPAPRHRRPEAQTSRPASGPVRVLLVDDHKVMRDGLATLLAEEPGVAIVGQASNGTEGIELARELQPDVVIMDVAMPVMAGDEATRRIRREMPHIRVIALSTFEEPGMAQMMREAGADVYLSKAGPAEDLIAAIRGH